MLEAEEIDPETLLGQQKRELKEELKQVKAE